MSGETVNLIHDDYFTQRNNPVVHDAGTGLTVMPYEACMPTARVMFYKGNRIAYTNPSHLPDDAYLTSVLIAPEALALATKKYPELVAAGFPPNQIHGMYHSYLDPLICGRRTSDFRTDLSFDDYVDLIKAGRVVMTSGAFQGRKGPINGHAFVLVGIDADGSLLMADPYGIFHTNYDSDQGYLVPMTRDEFVAHVKPVGALHKYGHVPLES
jgi:hypothetical protein